MVFGFLPNDFRNERSLLKVELMNEDSRKFVKKSCKIRSLRIDCHCKEFCFHSVTSFSVNPLELWSSVLQKYKFISFSPQKF